MARRVSKTGRSRWNRHWSEITAGILFLIVLLAIAFYYFWSIDWSNREPLVCDVNESTPLDAVLQKDGSYRDRNGLVYPSGYYFRVNGTLRGCTCALKPCIRKCCQEDEAISMETNKCTVNNYSSPFERFNMKTYRMVNSTPTVVNLTSNHFTKIYGDVCFYGKFLLTPEQSPSDVFYLMSDGTIFYQDSFCRISQYCMDSFIGSSDILTLVCFSSEQDVVTEDDFRLYSTGMFISLPFLFLTFLVYSILSELQNLHGKSLMCYVLSLFFAYFLLGFIQINKELLQVLCMTFAFIIQFSFLASFFWLNIMCFDIWWVFSGLRPLRGSVKEREHKKFIIYSIYAWGCPLIIFIITLLMQTLQNIPDSFIKPEFGVDKCWFKSTMAMFLYFYLPIIILVVLNIIMFITTAIRLRAHTKETEVLKNGESRRHDENERQRFNLYLKLFIVMGVNWVMELVSWLAGGPKYLWYVTDVTNTLQGVLIFLIFVWKRRILRLLNAKLCPSLNLVPTTTSSTRSKVSPSRTTSTSLKKTSSTNMNPAPDSISLKKIQTSDESDAPA